MNETAARRVASNVRARAVLYAQRAIPGTPIRRGDVIVLRYGHERNPGRRWVRLQRRHLALLAEEVGQAVELLKVGPCFQLSPMETVQHSLRLSAARGADTTSPCFVLRPLVSTVSVPIEADGNAGVKEVPAIAVPT